MNIPYVMKRCGKCGEWKVASAINFYKNKKGKYGLRSQCKECEKKYNKQWCETNKDKVAKYSKQYRENNKDKITEYSKRYYKANKDKMAEYHKQWQNDNRDKITEYHKQWQKDNRDKIAEHQKRYRQTPQGQAARFNSSNKRRRKKEAQGTGATGDQWLEMMKFFNWKCAYSGEYIGGNDNSFNRTIDHIVPIDAGGDDMAWNMVPMLRNLNSSKNSKNMEEWYREQSFYSEARLAKIYEWQEYAYNKWGKDTQYFNTNDIQIKLI